MGCSFLTKNFINKNPKCSVLVIKEYKMCDIISFKTGIDKNNINSFNSINSLPWIKLGTLMNTMSIMIVVNI